MTLAGTDFEFVRSVAGAPVLVVFGGFAEGFGLPPYEFERVVSTLPPVNVLFVRDRRQVWYQAGIVGLGSSLEESHGRLGSMLSDIGSERVVFTGNSAGGFGAIQAAVSGHCRCDQVLAFAPQTTLQNRWRQRHRDLRWPEQVAATHAAVGHPDSERLDLRAAVRHSRHPSITIHVSALHRLDLLHALRLASGARVKIRPHLSRGHGLIRDLRNNHRLVPLLRSSLHV